MHRPRLNFAKLILTAIGGMAAFVAGHGEHYHADRQTPKRTRTRGRVGGGTYGKNIMAHFDRVGINWSAKGEKVHKPMSKTQLKRKYGRIYVQDLSHKLPADGTVIYATDSGHMDLRGKAPDFIVLDDPHAITLRS